VDDKRILIVSSFVEPHVGGVERIVSWMRDCLRRHGFAVRTVSCRHRQAQADLLLPAFFLAAAGWPLPRGGLGALWREIGEADLVVCHSHLHPLSCLAALAARLRRRPCVFVVHAADDGATGSWAYRILARAFGASLARAALATSSCVLTLSRPGGAYVERRFGIVPAVIACPVEGLAPAAERDYDGREPFELVWLGRLSPEKDPTLAVAAVERARTALDARLTLIGDGPLRDRLAEAARARPWLRLAGELERAQALALQGEAHAALSSSRADAAQMAVLEALLRGLPAISTRVGEAPAYYEPALTRFCVEPTEEALAEALRALAADYRQARRLFAANGARLRERHSSAEEALLELLGRLL
jgi:glycosyltransferase involved in cell wall biosynthesis